MSQPLQKLFIQACIANKIPYDNRVEMANQRQLVRLLELEQARKLLTSDVSGMPYVNSIYLDAYENGVTEAGIAYLNLRLDIIEELALSIAEQKQPLQPTDYVTADPALRIHEKYRTPVYVPFKLNLSYLKAWWKGVFGK